MTTAIILAGGATDEEWERASGMRARALVPVRGEPMYRHVVRALQGAPQIERILIVGEVPPGEGYEVLPPPNGLIESVQRGLEASQTESVLFVAVDVPFLTAESVRFFLEASLQSGAALTYAVVPAALCRERFPQMRRTTVRLREGELTGGNLFWARRAVALRELPRLRALYAARKQPLRLALYVGVGILLRFLLAQWISPRFLSVRDVERRAERLLGVPARAILCPYAEIGADVDTLQQWQQIEQTCNEAR
ncbi:MAG: nucleotidyltransferase family protein [Fimbriimonadales bacterium]|nr:nucleotidyltransferase family protein [Fimbriimonadales bacterium]